MTQQIKKKEKISLLERGLNIDPTEISKPDTIKRVSLEFEQLRQSEIQEKLLELESSKLEHSTMEEADTEASASQPPITYMESDDDTRQLQPLSNIDIRDIVQTESDNE